MRILCVSDVVEKFFFESQEADKINLDILVSCGDLPLDYLEFLVTKYNVPLLYVHGNHDLYGRGVTGDFDGIPFLNQLSKSRFDFGYQFDYRGSFGGVNVDCKILNVKGIDFVGFDGSYKYNNGPHQFTEEEMRRKVRSVDFRLTLRKLLFGKSVDVVITHAPPFGIHDGKDLPHRGFKVFLDFMKKYKPKYLLHGHVHIYDRRESRITIYEGVKVVNCYGHYVIDL
jgi:Icc-related predicted phosphoesterase